MISSLTQVPPLTAGLSSSSPSPCSVARRRARSTSKAARLKGQQVILPDRVHSTIGGILTPAQLKRELLRISWGNVRLAEKLGVWPTEVRDWLSGKEPVPEIVASDIRHLPSAQ